MSESYARVKATLTGDRVRSMVAVTAVASRLRMHSGTRAFERSEPHLVYATERERCATYGCRRLASVRLACSQ